MGKLIEIRFMTLELRKGGSLSETDSQEIQAKLGGGTLLREIS